MPVGGVLFSEMTPDPEWEADFHDWYDHEHIPVRMGAPGFIGAQRYARLDGTGYLAIYDMDGPEALQTDAYKQIKTQPSSRTARMLAEVKGFTRYTGRLLSWQPRDGISEAEFLESSVVYPVFFTVPESRRDDFNAWYTQEHVPMLLAEPLWLGCRRYEIIDGAPEGYTHLALHHLATREALDSPAREAARQTEWRDRLAAEDWFKGSYMLFSRRGERFTANRLD
jgi:hypothetical protein